MGVAAYISPQAELSNFQQSGSLFYFGQFGGRFKDLSSKILLLVIKASAISDSDKIFHRPLFFFF